MAIKKWIPSQDRSNENSFESELQKWADRRDWANYVAKEFHKIFAPVPESSVIRYERPSQRREQVFTSADRKLAKSMGIKL